MNDQNAIDISVITTLKGLMKDRFSFLIETFINKTEGQLEELKQAIENNSIDDIVSITHSLKGSAGSVGANSIHQLCKDYEASARAGNLERVETWLDRLQNEYTKYSEEIKSHM